MGILDYYLSSGDIVWWDYHVWENMGTTNSTVVGSFPEPFVHGYDGHVEGITIMSTSDAEDSAEILRQTLMNYGSAEVTIEALDN